MCFLSQISHHNKKNITATTKTNQQITTEHLSYMCVCIYIYIHMKLTLRDILIERKKGTVINDMLLFGHSVVSDSLPPHGLQHAGLPYPSPSPGPCSNSWPLNWWYHAINDTAFAYELYLVGEVRKNKWKVNSFASLMVTEKPLLPWFHKYWPLCACLTFFLLVPITRHWPFNANAPQHSLVLVVSDSVQPHRR